MKAARFLGALAAAALVVSSLSACQQRGGAAALVGSSRISESDVGRYLGLDAKSSSSTDPQTGQTTVSNPKSDVLAFLIANKLFDDVFATVPGGAPTTSALVSARANTVTQIGGTTIDDLKASVVQAGFKSNFADVYVDANTKFSLLAAAMKGDRAAVLAAINKLNEKVDVNPRYGTWDPASLGIQAGPAIPSFLRLSGTTAAVDANTS